MLSFVAFRALGRMGEGFRGEVGSVYRLVSVGCL